MNGGNSTKAESVFHRLSRAQREAVETTDGYVLLIAGPGAGKTLTLIRRTLHILATGLAEPSEVVLCTFTEKAAYELKERLRAGVEAIGIAQDISGMRIGTIHGVCNEFVDRHRHLTPLGNSYEVLDDLTQLLFLYDHFEDVIGAPDPHDKYLTRWATRWTAIEGARRYFDKITEELVDADGLTAAADPFLGAIGRAYLAYENALVSENRVDFAHIQKLFLDILNDPAVGPKVSGSARYVMVDEYQDTNYIQERLLSRLAETHGNLCVVGDEDQSIYRFRGATVRNILEFPSRFPSAHVIKLTTNYRSHGTIVRAYDKYMASANWSNRSGGPSFRFPKTIEPDPEAAFPEYPAVISIWGTGVKDEADRFGELVAFLRDQNVIEDYSQVALLLHSVRSDHSGAYIEAMERRGIPAFCPRARAFFDNEEVRAVVACFALILGYHGDNRGTIAGRALQGLSDYVDDCLVDLARRYADPHALAAKLQQFVAEIDRLEEDGALDRRPADYLYELLAVQPFATWLGNENRSRNLATLSQLLNEFQRYYHFTVVTHRNVRVLRLSLFNSFLRLLYDGGINEYEDPDRPFPKGHVQIMTIHQAKGLEFPVVGVGSLAVQLSSPKDVDNTLGAYYHRPAFEPETRVTTFDRMRLHYVAFSRAEKILVLTTDEEPKHHFDAIWQGLPQWPYVQTGLIAAQGFSLRERLAPKRSYSFTGDLKVYETCPRQYQMFREYKFTPSRSAVIFFGLLVHQTIEDVHRLVMSQGADAVTESRVDDFFEFNFRHLARQDVRPIGETAKAAARGHVLDYVRNNREQMRRVVETEVDVSLEKDDYVLTGTIDLLLADDGAFEILDFKAQRRPPDGDPILRSYYKQLCLYAHIVEERRGRRPDRLLLYWTGESERDRALMEFDYRPEDVADAAAHFDDVVGAVRAGRFEVVQPPDRSVCKECDFRSYCIADKTIDEKVIA